MPSPWLHHSCLDLLDTHINVYLILYIYIYIHTYVGPHLYLKREHPWNHVIWQRKQKSWKISLPFSHQPRNRCVNGRSHKRTWATGRSLPDASDAIHSDQVESSSTRDQGCHSAAHHGSFVPGFCTHISRMQDASK